MRALVIGGAGFIGSHLAETLIKKGFHVTVIDNLSTGRKEQVPKDATFIYHDITDPTTIDLIAEGNYDYVFHQAAQMNLRRSVERPAWDAQINIIGSLHVLEGAVKGKVKQLIFASSGGTCYGEQQHYPCDETHPLNPISPYGVAKVSVEKYLYCYAYNYGLSYVALRYANVYGPRQNPHGEAGVIAIFAQKMLQGENPVIFGDGEQTRDFVYIDDVIEANLRVINYPENVAFNIGTGIETSVNEIFRLMNAYFDNRFQPVYAPPKKGELRRSALSYQRIYKALQWKPKIALKQGIIKTLQWFEKHYATA